MRIRSLAMHVAAAAALAAALPSAAAAAEPVRIIVPAALYPADARAAHVEGDVPVELEIGAAGDVRCHVPPGGPLVLLKRASCMLLVQRPVFGPNFDAQGRPVATTIAFLVRWRVGASNGDFGGAVPVSPERWVRREDYPYVGAGQVSKAIVTVGFTVTAAGRIADCAVTQSSGSLIADQRLCPLLVKRALLLPALGADGQPIATHGMLTHRWKSTE